MLFSFSCFLGDFLGDIIIFGDFTGELTLFLTDLLGDDFIGEFMLYLDPDLLSIFKDDPLLEMPRLDLMPLLSVLLRSFDSA